MRAYSFRLSGALYEAGSWYDQVKLIYRAALRVSRDDGKTWTQFLLSDSTSAAYSVVPHPTNGNIIYVGGEIASASGSTTSELRVAPLNISARDRGGSRRSSFAATRPITAMMTRNAA